MGDVLSGKGYCCVEMSCVHLLVGFCQEYRCCTVNHSLENLILFRDGLTNMLILPTGQ